MIVRLVKLTIQPEMMVDFIAIFEKSKATIRAFDGCLHLELLQDQTHPHIFFTLSHWENEAALENYRQSTFFQQTWTSTKLLFAEKAMAWSLGQWLFE
jgi:quinol monooxygenase YgiN